MNLPIHVLVNFNTLILENPRVEAFEAGVSAGRGQVPQGEHRPPVRRRLRLPARLPRRRAVRRLRALRQDEGEAHHGRQGGRGQDQAGRGAAQGPERVHEVAASDDRELRPEGLTGWTSFPVKFCPSHGCLLEELLDWVDGT